MLAPPLDLVSIGSNDIPRAREFYRLALRPLGIGIVDEVQVHPQPQRRARTLTAHANRVLGGAGG